MTNETGKKPAIHKKHVARLERERQQTRLILYAFFGILGAVVLLLFYGWLDANYLQINRAAAKVGDTSILVKDLEPRIRLRRQQLLDNYSQALQFQQYFGMDMSQQIQEIEFQLSAPEFIGQSVLDELVNEEIIRQEAAKRGITVSEEELNARVEEGFGFFPNGTPTPSLTPTAFDLPTEPAEILEFITATPEATGTPQSTTTAEPAATATAQPTLEGGTPAATATTTLEPTATATLVPTLTATVGPTVTPLPTGTPYTREGFEGLLTDTNDNLAELGFGADYYRDFFETQILTEKLKEIITADVQPTEEQVRARHILVADEATALDIITRLQAGEDFAELARELSTDTGSAVQGGDLGWFGKNAMVPEFEAAAFALANPGDFTLEPVQSNFGFHIIQLIGRQDRPLNAEELETAKNTAFQAWLTTAREEEYTVETFDVWKQRVPTEPNFITIATKEASVGQTAQAEQLSTLEASNDATQTAAP